MRPFLDAYLKNCIKNVVAGRKFSIDEITIGFQGHHAKLKVKLRCGKFKRAGDGFQADAIVLDGGYVLFLVFRGDNTTPIYEAKFSPLHNRCLLLLSALIRDGHQGWWDNLYSSVDVMQQIARGGEYTATYPAGPKAGTTSSIKVPATGLSGTARTNRGIPPSCRQPKKTDLTKKKLEALKEQPLEDRVKTAMTTTEPRVLCASVFDNGPVHMLDTIHTSAGIIAIPKQRFDRAINATRSIPLRILAVTPPPPPHPPTHLAMGFPMRQPPLPGPTSGTDVHVGEGAHALGPLCPRTPHANPAHTSESHENQVHTTRANHTKNKCTRRSSMNTTKT